MTNGELRMRITQMFPSLGLEIIDGFISDVLADILHELPWERQNIVAVLRTVAPYSTGAVTVTLGSRNVTGSGTTWTSAMTGRGFRVTGRDEVYEFLRTADTTAVLDREYEGTTAAGAGYKVFQHIHLLPADCRMLESNAFPALKRLDRSQLGSDPQYGCPTAWASYMDTASTPPRMQVQLDPIPDAIHSFEYTYQAETAAPGTSGTTLLPWIQPSALVAGVMAKCCALPVFKDYVGAAFHVAAYRKAVDTMLGAEAQGMAPTTMQLPCHYTAHRRRRW